MVAQSVDEECRTALTDEMISDGIAALKAVRAEWLTFGLEEEDEEQLVTAVYRAMAEKSAWGQCSTGAMLDAQAALEAAERCYRRLRERHE